MSIRQGNERIVFWGSRNGVRLPFWKPKHTRHYIFANAFKTNAKFAIKNVNVKWNLSLETKQRTT
uniref:GH26692p n=1 Tax=Drosophila melanogaster TaxID=7227 RepID=Q8SZJ4_DROME|nr:GH26692p [Drosophila melanogaster]